MSPRIGYKAQTPTARFAQGTECCAEEEGRRGLDGPLYFITERQIIIQDPDIYQTDPQH